MIDTSFDFTMDSPHYWDTFWDNNYGLGGGGSDPDSASPMLQKYHQELWSRQLPNGQFMNLETGYGSRYLTWEDMRFGSDSIIASFRYDRCRTLITELKEQLSDYYKFIEGFIHKTYTMGGMVILPKHRNSINQVRGTNKLIADRWDLTLECIRRYYIGEDSPIKWCLDQDKDFFELFIDFKGYVDYFFLQDLVSDDYSRVKLWLGQENVLGEEPVPTTVDAYMHYLNNEISFVEKRNARINEYLMRKQRYQICIKKDKEGLVDMIGLFV